MVNLSQQSSIPRGSSTPRPVPAPLYGAAVVALAVFFMGLTFWRSPIEGYIVTSEVGYISSVSMANARSTAAHAPVEWSREVNLQQIANAVRAADKLANKEIGCDNTEHVLSADHLREISQRIDVKTMRRGSQESGSALSFQGEDLGWSIAFVDHLARQILSGHYDISPATESTPESIREAKWLMEQSRHYERKARFDMEGALNAYFERTRDASRGTSTEAVAALKAETVKAETAAPTRQLNPNWARLQDGLAQLRDKLAELLKTVTPSHPQARHLTLQIEQLQRALAATPRYLDDSAQHAPAAATEPGAGAKSDGRWGSQPVAFVSPDEPEVGLRGARLVEPADYRQLRDGYEMAIQQREAAERRFSELVTLHQADAQIGPIAPPGVIRPAALVRQIGGRPTGGIVLVIGGLAFLCGVAIFWRITSLQGFRQINSVEELQAALSLPLVGRISIDPMTAQPWRLARWARLVRGCIRTSELVLAVMIVVFFVSILSDGPVAKELADNPLGTFVQRVAESIGI